MILAVYREVAAQPPDMVLPIYEEVAAEPPEGQRCMEVDRVRLV